MAWRSGDIDDDPAFWDAVEAAVPASRLSQSNTVNQINPKPTWNPPSNAQRLQPLSTLPPSVQPHNQPVNPSNNQSNTAAQRNPYLVARPFGQLPNQPHINQQYGSPANQFNNQHYNKQYNQQPLNKPINQPITPPSHQPPVRQSNNHAPISQAISEQIEQSLAPHQPLRQNHLQSAFNASADRAAARQALSDHLELSLADYFPEESQQVRTEQSLKRKEPEPSVNHIPYLNGNAASKVARPNPSSDSSFQSMPTVHIQQVSTLDPAVQSAIKPPVEFVHPPPLCGHLEPKKLLQSKSARNPGRKFYVCARPESEQCKNSFEWADEADKRKQLVAPLMPMTHVGNQIPVDGPGLHHHSNIQQPAPQLAPGQKPIIVLAVEAINCVQFALTFTPFDQHCVELCNEFHGSFDAVEKHWLFPLSQYDVVMSAFKNHAAFKAEVNDEIPKPIRAALSREVNVRRIEDATFHKVLPPKIAKSLLPFQYEGVRFALNHGGRCHIADEMGVGKSIQAIAVMAWYSEDWPVLIVCPSSLRYNWQMELMKWLPNDRQCPEDIEDMIDVIAKSSQVSWVDDRVQRRESNFITIISYDLLAKEKCYTTINSVKYGVMICDESHAIKSHDTQRTKAVVPIIKAVKHCLLLSGTPALNRPAELYTQISALRPDMFPTFQSFGRRYCAPSQSRWGQTYDGGAHLQELHLVLKRHLMIRRLKADVLPQLPPKRRQAVIVECPPVKKGERATYQRDNESASSWFERALQDGISDSKSPDDSSIMRLFGLAATLKTKPVIEYCFELLENCPKFVLFYHHRELGDAICDSFQAKNVSFIRIDGQTPGQTRQQMVQLFQTSPQHRVAVLSLTAASTGFTLTAASTVIFAELYWSPSLLLQGEDRCHRIGSAAECINIQYILGKNTVDEIIWPMLTSKLDLISLSLNGFKQDELALAGPSSSQQEEGVDPSQQQSQPVQFVQPARQQGIERYFQAESDVPALETVVHDERDDLLELLDD